MIKLKWLFIVSLFPYIIYGQKLKIAVSKNSVLIGEQFDIIVRSDKTIGEKLDFNEEFNKLELKFKNEQGTYIPSDAKFEILSTKKRPIDNLNNEWKLKAVVWDSGYFLFPSISYTVNGKIFRSDSILIEGQLVEKKSGQDIYDIKETFSNVDTKNEQVKNSNNSNYLLIIIVFILIIVIIFIYFKLYRKRNFERISELSLAEKAIREIDELEKLELWKINRHKEHFVQLSFILRSYLSKITGIIFLEKTTTESILLLNQKDFPVSQIMEIEFILKHADMVKFAKSILEEEYILKLDNQARSCIKRLESLN